MLLASLWCHFSYAIPPLTMQTSLTLRARLSWLLMHPRPMHPLVSGLSFPWLCHSLPLSVSLFNLLLHIIITFQFSRFLAMAFTSRSDVAPTSALFLSQFLSPFLLLLWSRVFPSVLDCVVAAPSLWCTMFFLLSTIPHSTLLFVHYCSVSGSLWHLVWPWQKLKLSRLLMLLCVSVNCLQSV